MNTNCVPMIVSTYDSLWCNGTLGWRVRLALDNLFINKGYLKLICSKTQVNEPYLNFLCSKYMFLIISCVPAYLDPYCFQFSMKI